VEELMELNEVERFLVHLGVHSNMTKNKGEFKEVMDYIRMNRCRSLSDEQVKEIIDAVKHELILSKAMWRDI